MEQSEINAAIAAVYNLGALHQAHQEEYQRALNERDYFKDLSDTYEDILTAYTEAYGDLPKRESNVIPINEAAYDVLSPKEDA